MKTYDIIITEIFYDMEDFIMKRLKYLHLFYGKTIPVIISISAVYIVIMPILVLILSDIENKFYHIYFVIINISIILLTLAVDYAVIHRLKPEEKKKIAEASPPVWKKLPDRMKKKFHINKKDSLTSVAVAIGLNFIVAFIVLLADGVQTMLVSLAVFLPATFIVLACLAV